VHQDPTPCPLASPTRQPVKLAISVRRFIATNLLTTTACILLWIPFYLSSATTARPATAAATQTRPPSWAQVLSELHREHS
jgi:hypothetical protein